jgi:hypothetical protein
MTVLPLFFGFLFGAVIGTIATASRGEDLHEEAATWFRELRIRRKRKRKRRLKRNESLELRKQAPAALENVTKLVRQQRAQHKGFRWPWPGLRQKLRRLMASAGRLPLATLAMKKVHVLAIFILIWIIGLIYLVWWPAWEDRPYVRYILGTLVGAAAAPWIWLHFSRNLQAAGSADEGLFERYRFMTYVLGAALLVAVIEPYLGKLLPRANKIEGFGVALNLALPRNDRGGAIPETGQPISTFGKTVGRLANATTLAHRVTAGRREAAALGGDRKKLKDVKQELDGFENLSVRDRDRVYIAYFHRQQKAQADQPSSDASFSNLQEYVEGTPAAFAQSPDDRFLASLADVSECISLYAENIRDFRLFLVKSEPFLKSLLVNFASQWREKDATGSDSTLVPNVAGQPNKSGGATSTSVARTEIELKDQIGQLGDEIWKALLASGSVTEKHPCGTTAFADKKVPVEAIGTTPYPAYLIAHYLAAIDSVESGVLVLRDWLLRQKKQIETEKLFHGPEQDWYSIRAMLASSQIPYRFGSGLPTHRALVLFQKATTDRFGKLLGVHDAGSWKALCRRLNRSGLHARIGRYLAWTYADERNYLFELLQPEDFGTPKDPGLAITKVSPSTYLDEAEAILESSNCFDGVPRFTNDYSSLIGLFSLNAAQLRIAKRISTEGEERAVLTRKIRSDLDRARQLQPDNPTPTIEILDLQRQGSEFDVHVGRLARLRATLDNEAERD